MVLTGRSLKLRPFSARRILRSRTVPIWLLPVTNWTSYFFLLATLNHVPDEPHRPRLPRRASRADRAGLRALPACRALAPWYVAWNALAIAAILLLARKQHDSPLWEFAHDWLPALFFITVFEEVSFLSLALRGAWQNPLPHRLGSCAVRGASGRVAAPLLVAVVPRAAGVRLLQLLPALSRGRRSALGLASPCPLRRGLPPHDRRAQRGLRRLLRHLSAVPYAQPIPQCGT